MARLERERTNSAIKRINERLAEFERHPAYMESRQYNSLLDQLRIIGVKLGKSKSGHTKIEKVKGGYSKKISKKLQNLGKYGKGITYGKTKNFIEKMAKDMGIPIVKGLGVPLKKDFIKKITDVHNYIETHKYSIYLVEALADAVHRSSNLSWDEVEDLLNMEETHREELEEERKKLEKKIEESTNEPSDEWFNALRNRNGN